MNDFQIKIATTDDVPTIIDLATEIWNDHYISAFPQEQIDYMLDLLYSKKKLLKHLADGYHFFLVYIQQKPIGFFSYYLQDKNSFLLQKIYLKSEHQGKGLGKKILDYIMKLLPKESILRLMVNRKNFTAINFYFKNGFKIEDIKDLDIGNGYFMHDFVMKTVIP